MKKLLSLLLVAVMLVATCSVVIASAAGASTLLGWAHDASWTKVDGEINGAWQGSKPAFGLSYSYASKLENGMLNIGLKIDTDLTGTSASIGNGQGTNVRVWLHVPGSKVGNVACTAYNYFLDVSYADGAFLTQMKHNTSATENVAEDLFKYTDAATVGGKNSVVVKSEITKKTAENKLAVDHTDLQISIPMSLIGATDKVEAILVVSNKPAGANEALYSNSCKVNNQWSWAVWAAPSIAYPIDGELLGETWTTVDATKGGHVQNKPADTVMTEIAFSYATLLREDGMLKIGLKVNSPLFGTATAWGNNTNGGTYVRVWVKVTDASVNSQTQLIDLAYIDGRFIGQFANKLYNAADASKSKGAAPVNFNTGVLPFDFNYALYKDNKGADINITIPTSALGVAADGKVELVFSVSNRTDKLTTQALFSNDDHNIWSVWNNPSVIYPKTTYTWGDKIVANTEKNITKDATMLGDTTATTDYAGDLTDGKIGTNKYDTAVWFAWKANASVTFDFGKIRSDITSIAAHIWPANESGIAVPSVTILASQDGVNYGVVKTVTQAELEKTLIDETDRTGKPTGKKFGMPQWINVKFDNYLNARYVRFEFAKTKDTFIFCSELQINATNATIKLSDTGYHHASGVSVILAGDGQTVAEITARGNNGVAKDMNYFNVITVNPNGYVTGVYSDGAKSAVICPKGGYILGVNKDNKAAADILNIKVGAKIALYGLTDMDMIIAKQGAGYRALANAYFTYENPIVAQQNLTIGYIGYKHADSASVLLAGDNETVATLTARGNGGAMRDMNMYKVIVVDASNKVVETNFKTGSDAGKYSMVCPKGGYILAVNVTGNAEAAKWDNIKVGATIELYGITDADIAKAKDRNGGNYKIDNAYFVYHNEEIVKPTFESGIDADGDGKLTAADATFLMNVVAGTAYMDPKNISKVDFNNNGEVDIYDCVALLQYLAGALK